MVSILLSFKTVSFLAKFDSFSVYTHAYTFLSSLVAFPDSEVVITIIGLGYVVHV